MSWEGEEAQRGRTGSVGTKPTCTRFSRQHVIQASPRGEGLAIGKRGALPPSQNARRRCNSQPRRSSAFNAGRSGDSSPGLPCRSSFLAASKQRDEIGEEYADSYALDGVLLCSCARG